MADSPTPRRGSCVGRVVKLALVLLVLLGVLVGFLPWIASSGPGTRFIERIASRQVNGSLAIGDLDLSWSGGQSIKGLVLDDPAGRNIAKLDLSVANGLLDLARGGWMRADATISGSVQVDLRPDGSTNVAQVAKPSPTPAPAPPAPKPASVLPPGLDATVNIAGLDVTIHEAATGRVVKLEDLNGKAVVGTVRPITLTLAGGSEFEQRAGTIALEATLTDLVRRDGSLSFPGAKAHGSAKLVGLALPLPQMLVEVKSLQATLSSADLAKEIAVDLDSQATLNGNTPSTATAKVVARDLFKPDGSMAFRPENLVADIVATNLPTALLDPFLKDQPLVASRDIGPTADATIKFPGGGGDVTLQLTAQQLQVAGTGSIDAATGGLVVNSLKATGSVQPALLEAAAGLSSPRPIAVVVESGRIVVPGAESGKPFPTGDISLESLSIALPGSVDLSRMVAQAGGAPASEPLASANDLQIAVKSPRLRDVLEVVGGGRLEGGTLAIDQRITNLFGPDGSVDAAGAVAVGSISLSGIAPQRILGVLPPDQAQIARELLTGPIEAKLSTAGGAERQALLTVASGGLRADADALLKGRTLSVRSAKAVVPATSALLAALQQGSDKPVQTTPTALTAVLKPLEIDLDALGSFVTRGPQVVANLALADATFSNVPGAATPLGVSGFSGVATITPGQTMRIAFDGGARTTAAGASLAALTAMIDAGIPAASAPGAGEPMSLTAQLALAEIQVSSVEALLGRPSGSLSRMLGKSGAVALTATPRPGGALQVVATPTFESMNGAVDATIASELATVGSGRVEFTLSPAQLDAFMAARPAGAGPAQPGAAPALTFGTPLKVVATLSDTVVALPALAGEPFDPTKVRTTLTVSTTPIAMLLASGQKIDFDGFNAKIATPRIDQGVTIEASARGAGSAVFTANGVVRNLVDGAARLAPGGAAIDLQATLKNLPTALLDRMQELDGLLVTTLGDLVEGSLDVKGLSATAGQLSARLSAANGRIDVPQATIRDGLVVIDPAKPITGELAITKPLRDRLLYKVNPILADIRQTQQPIRLQIPGFAYPLDGDMSRLDGDVKFTFGEVAFDTGSELLGFLEIFNKKTDATIPGLVDPLNIVIRKGQLTYADFRLQVGKDSAGWKQVLDFSGDVDLAAKPPFVRAIRSMYPADGLARSIKELKQIPALGAVAVGITFFGPLYDAAGNSKKLESKVDFKLKPEEILKDKQLQETVGDALGDLFKKLNKDKK